MTVLDGNGNPLGPVSLVLGQVFGLPEEIIDRHLAAELGVNAGTAGLISELHRSLDAPTDDDDDISDEEVIELAFSIGRVPSSEWSSQDNALDAFEQVLEMDFRRTLVADAKLVSVSCEDDPLGVLAEIVDYVPEFDLEDQLLREFERYDVLGPQGDPIVEPFVRLVADLTRYDLLSSKHGGLDD